MNSSGRYPFDDQDKMNKVIKAYGETETYFDSNGNWHVYMGQREPPDKRIRAQLLKILEGNLFHASLDRVEFGA
jgi:hypothetical protein